MNDQNVMNAAENQPANKAGMTIKVVKVVVTFLGGLATGIIGTLGGQKIGAKRKAKAEKKAAEAKVEEETESE